MYTNMNTHVYEVSSMFILHKYSWKYIIYTIVHQIYIVAIIFSYNTTNKKK